MQNTLKGMGSFQSCDTSDLAKEPEIIKFYAKCGKNFCKKINLRLSNKTIVNAERQACNFLSNDHQRTCDIQRICSIVVILTM
jgi:hypothetical protein